MTRALLRVALTGGIATGKSVCLARFAARGTPVIDADALARAAVAAGTPGLAAVLHRFGPAVRGADGGLDRAALARVVFDDPAARRDLEAIVHPIVRSGIARRLEELQQDVGCTSVVVDIPLLFETGREREFDRVVVTWCRPEQQLERLLLRPGMTESEARQRLASQWPADEKKRRADVVIDTTGSIEETHRQVDALVDTGFGQTAGD